MYRVYECVCPLRHVENDNLSKVCRVLVCVSFEASVCIACVKLTDCQT